jgi:glycosyltransferase involved in cell wall biosynthesis
LGSRFSLWLRLIHQIEILVNTLPTGNVRFIPIYHGTYNGYAQAYWHFSLGRLGAYYRFAASLESRCVRMLSRESTGNAVVTGVSPSTLAELHSSGLVPKAHFVTNGLPEFLPSSIERTSGRGRIGDHKVLLYVGSGLDVASKRSHLLPSLAQVLTRDRPKVDLIMACGLPASVWRQRDMWPSNVNALGFVQRPTLERLFAAADAFVSLSCYEGMPNSVLEAAVHGLPLILTDIPSHRWILSSGIGNGILVYPHRPLDDAGRIAEFLDSSRCVRTLPPRGIVEKYHWDNIATEYLKLGGLR